MTTPSAAPAGGSRELRVQDSAEPEWTGLIQRLWQERDSLVREFLRRFAAVSYDEALVPDEDIRRTAVDTMDLLLLEMAGAPIPPELATLPRDVAVRRARQGVPLEAFLAAVRNDFRVLWQGLERVARPDRLEVLVAHMDRVLDTVEGYISSIQQAFAEEEALLARDKQLYRQRVLSRLFAGDSEDPARVAEIASALGVRAEDDFEVLAVVGDAAAPARRRYETDPRAFVHEMPGGLCVFRPLRPGAAWPDDPPPVPAGCAPTADGLAAVPRAAATALLLAGHRPGAPGLVTVADAWTGIAAELLEERLPGLSAPVTRALDRCTPHERRRLLEVARSYARTGSIKRTAEELYCHRNTVVNRLHALHRIIGLDLTVPAEAALALVSLSGYDEPPGIVTMHKPRP
jgi:hypothetical protein